MDEFPLIIGQHPLILTIKLLLKKVAATGSTVLVGGETGTGKELAARAVHTHSLRAHHPFIPINCGALPAELLESEIFGHERGAFTGAIASRAGMFQLADGGTMFLDEIGEMSPLLQVKLLRVLQDGEIRPIGATRTTKVDVRIIAATNKDLALEIKRHAFREDLFYRLDVIPIVMPPLRERRSDIPLFIDHFLEKHHRKRSGPPVRISAEATGRLARYDWPGNVRELENVVERIVILSEDTLVDSADLPLNIRDFIAGESDPPPTLVGGGVDLNRALESYETKLIDEALGQTKGNRMAAARLLGIKRTTLVAKLGRRPPIATFPPVQSYLL